MAIDWDPIAYEQWFETPEGRYALESEVRLLQSVLAGWPRRKRKLLEVGCGSGLFLEMLYQMGFDVTGVDKDSEMLAVARKRLSNRAELHQANAEILPYEDNEFDYAFLWSVIEFTQDPIVMLKEAARVAEKGLLLGYLNKNSLYYHMNVRNGDGPLSQGNWYTWCEVQDIIKQATGLTPTLARSVLPGPKQTWRSSGMGGRLNDGLYPPFAGAFAAVRVDFVNMKPLNPLFSWKREPSY